MAWEVGARPRKGRPREAAGDGRSARSFQGAGGSGAHRESGHLGEGWLAVPNTWPKSPWASCWGFGLASSDKRPSSPEGSFADSPPSSGQWGQQTDRKPSQQKRLATMLRADPRVQDPEHPRPGRATPKPDGGIPRTVAVYGLVFRRSAGQVWCLILTLGGDFQSPFESIGEEHGSAILRRPLMVNNGAGAFLARSAARR